MRRPLRLVDGAGRPVDVTVEPAPDATVGDLADALATLIGAPPGATIASRWPIDRRAAPPARTRPLATDGPRAGSTVVLVDDPAGATGEPPIAPVRLIGRCGETIELAYGPTHLGGAVVEVGAHVSIRGIGGSDARVGGEPLLGSTRIVDGDLLTIAGSLWTLRVEAALVPPVRHGWTVSHRRRPAHIIEHEPVVLTLPTPPSRTRLPGFPVLSATVPLLMGVGLWFATRSWLSAGFMLFSVVFVVASGIEARREARAEDRARVAEFRTDLQDVVERIEGRRVEQRRRHESQGLDREQLSSMLDPSAERADPRIWERCGDASTPPSGMVRLGTADLPLGDPISVPDSGRRDLRIELAEVEHRLAVVADVVTVDLAITGGIVIEGVDESTVAAARSVVVQLAALIAPDELSVTLLVDGARAEAWSDLQWLPHVGGDRRPLDAVVADGSTLEALRAHLTQNRQSRTVVIWVTPPEGDRPAGIGAELEVRAGTATLRLRDADGGVVRVDDIEADLLGPDESEPIARGLAGLTPAGELWVPRPEVTAPATPTSLPRSVALTDVLASAELLDDPGAVAARWSLHCTGALASPIGVAEHGGVVNLDLALDGPHALIAGTTGAGKSELLRTFLVAAALHHSPDRLQFLLIDYKGGAAFGPLEALPHTVGAITDLSETLGRRALVSLRAELRRREATAAQEPDGRWSGAALLVVVDEFATLAAELPDFVDGLVDLAQRGRSLGLHLVLATQRPAGVVTESIRANTTMRLALRVADEDDSRDVVDSPDAAHLPREIPGRVVVRVGPNHAATVQVAYAGGPAATSVPVAVTPWRGDRAMRSTARTSDGGVCASTELEVAVRTAITAASISSTPLPRRPWLDPLPSRISCTELDDPPRRGVAVIGVVDRPEHQRREPLCIDLARDGGLVVIGAGGAGRSTLVASFATSVGRDRAEVWHVHVIGGSRGSEELEQLPAVDDVIDVEDTERVLRLLHRTVEEIDARAADDVARDRTRRVIVVDGIGRMEERYERLDRGEAMDLLHRIAREGRAVGVHLVITAQRRAEVPVALAGLMGARVVLRCTTSDDAALLGLDDSAAAPDLPPGRCRVDGHVAQIAIPDARGRSGHRADVGLRPAPLRIPRLPTRLARVELRPSEHLAADVTEGGLVAIGLDGDSLVTAHLDLRRHHAIIAGPPHSGVSTTLASLIAGHPNARLVSGGVDDLGTAVPAALDLARSGRPTLLAVDAVPELLDGPDGTTVAALLDDLLRAGRELPVRLVVGGEVDALSACYHDVVATLRRERTGVLLGGDPELHGALFHASLRTRSDLPAAPGRGWLLGPGAASRVQVALP